MRQRVLIVVALVLIGTFGIVSSDSCKDLPQGACVPEYYNSPVTFIYADDIIEEKEGLETILGFENILYIPTLQEIREKKIDGNCKKISVVELTKGGEKKIIALTDKSSLYFVELSGTIRKECPVPNAKDFQVYDILPDKNDYHEIIVASSDGILIFQEPLSNCNKIKISEGRFDIVYVWSLKNENIIIGSSENKLYAFSTEGKSKWNFTAGGDISVISTGKISNFEAIIVGDRKGNVYVLNETGDKNYERSMPPDIVDIQVKDRDNDGINEILVGSGSTIYKWIPGNSYSEKTPCAEQGNIIKIGEGMLNGNPAIVSVYKNGKIYGIDLQLDKILFFHDLEKDGCKVINNVYITRMSLLDPNSDILVGCNDRLLKVKFKSEKISECETALILLESVKKLCTSPLSPKDDYKNGIISLKKVQPCYENKCCEEKFRSEIEKYAEYMDTCQGNIEDWEEADSMEEDAVQTKIKGKCNIAIKNASDAIKRYEHIRFRSNNEGLFDSNINEMETLTENCRKLLVEDENIKINANIVYVGALEHFRNENYESANESAKNAMVEYEKLNDPDEKSDGIVKCNSLIDTIDAKIEEAEKDKEFINFIKINLQSLKLFIIALISFLIAIKIRQESKSRFAFMAIFIFLWLTLFFIEGVIGLFNGISFQEILASDFLMHTIIRDIMSSTLGICGYVVSKNRSVRELLGLKDKKPKEQLLDSGLPLNDPRVLDAKLTKPRIICDFKDKAMQVIKKLETQQQTHVLIQDSGKRITMGDIHNSNPNNLRWFVDGYGESVTIKEYVENKRENNCGPREIVSANITDTINKVYYSMCKRNVHSILIETEETGLTEIIYKVDLETKTNVKKK